MFNIAEFKDLFVDVAAFHLRYMPHTFSKDFGRQNNTIIEAAYTVIHERFTIAQTTK